MNCVLCGSLNTQPLAVERPTLICSRCDLRFVHPKARVSSAAERARYELHEHDPADAGYRNFVAPLVDAVVKSVSPGTRGLDFGAGRVPVLANLLRERGYDVAFYDPFFWPDAGALSGKFDFITACEVIEHLHDPDSEFAGLSARLKPGAPLALMTEVYRDEIDFASWTYRRDPTHVCFYSARTFDWIADRFGFKTVSINGRVIVLSGRSAQ